MEKNAVIKGSAGAGKNAVKAALIGYGKMGRLMHDLSKGMGVEIVSTIDSNSPDAMFKEINRKSLEGCDVAIDFTHPKTAVENAGKYAEYGVNVVMGTTGWYSRLKEMENTVKSSGIGMIWSGNFSIGVNMFFRIVRAAAKIADKAAGYDAFSYELHHNQKADSPSGTANMIGKILLDELGSKNSLVYDKLDRRIAGNEIHVASVRGGSIPGTHVVGFDSPADTIELKHTARSREGFARGALMAAKWIAGRKGFYGIDDMMDEVLG